MPFQGNYTQQQYASDMISAFRNKGIDASRVWPQSFLYDDIVYWLQNDHDFGRQAAYLQEFDTPTDLAAGMANLTVARAAGVNIIAPALTMLLSIGGTDNKTIVESEYSKAIKANGMDIIAWTFERSGPLANVKKDEEYYFSTIADVITHDGQLYEVLDVLVREVGIKGLFTDWAATVTYFANCFGLEGPVGGSYS
jgi:glycerophosphoryl diester phosphodiesterase